MTVTDVELAQLRGLIERSQPDYMADLRTLVNIDCGSYTKVGVDIVGRIVADRFQALGATVEYVANAELGNTVVASWTGASGPNVLLIGHLDTVFSEGTAAGRPFKVRGTRAHGPGVTDMKAGLLAGLHAIAALKALGPLPFRELTFIANPDEEIGSPASRPVIRQHAASVDVALVLECARANGDIVSQRKGIADLGLRMVGRAAHAGIEPEKGRNAIVEAAHKTLALTALNGRWPGVTVNVGVVRGGSRPNVVPADALLEIDIRATTREALETAEAEVARICAISTVPDVTCSIEEKGRHWPMEKSAGTARLVEQAVELAGRLGFELRDAATGGASDANTTAGMGIPTLDGLGPIGGGDHSEEEYLELESVVPRTALLAGLLLTVARQGRAAD